MGHDMVVSRYAIPVGIPRFDGLSMGPRSFGLSQEGQYGLQIQRRIEEKEPTVEPWLN